ncbi:MAG: hypothetical protein EA428_05575 [Spirochaetaceae bacterium]|nr:MAG: hypothetical protein EA428_05575 [Spirochaetaceae bacterium]
MNRSVAIAVLGVFGLLFLGAAWWGWSDFRAWRTAVAACTTPLVIDQTSFWMMGMASIALLPLLGLTLNVMVHRVLFILLILWGLGVPMLSYISFLAQAEAQGYLVPSGARVLLFGEQMLHVPKCL